MTTTKYIYSPFYEHYKMPRVLDTDTSTMTLRPKYRVGRGNITGWVMDTGTKYPTIDDLKESMYQDYLQVVGEDEKWVFIRDQDNTYRIFKTIQHEVRQPGTYYCIEYAYYQHLHIGNLTNMDISTLYSDFESAQQAAMNHYKREHAATFNGVEFVSNGQYTQIKTMEGHESQVRYNIYPMVITEDIYEQALDVYDDRYDIVTPYTTFSES